MSSALFKETCEPENQKITKQQADSKRVFER